MGNKSKLEELAMEYYYGEGPYEDPSDQETGAFGDGFRCAIAEACLWCVRGEGDYRQGEHLYADELLEYLKGLLTKEEEP